MLTMSDLQHFLIKLLHNKKASLVCFTLLSLLIMKTLVSFLSLFNYAAPKPSAALYSQSKVEKTEVSKYHLFGEFLESDTLKPSESHLNLSLQAIFYVEGNPNKSSALISENNQAAKLYYPNDSLSHDVTIRQIMPNKVILYHEGTTQILSLPIPKLEFMPTPQNTLP